MKDEKILLIDDDPELREVVKRALNSYGYKNVVTAENSESALSYLKLETPALILLDIMMPGIDGLELLEIIRTTSTIPVILLTAKGEAEDKIKGFETGADDYVIKPFLMRELILRIEALLRRAYPNNHNIISLESCTVDLLKATVQKKDGNTVNLTAKELEILHKLYENAGNIVSVNALCQSVIGDIYTGYENTLMSHIRHLREKIEEDPSKPKSLITARGLGYKLIIKER